MLVLSLFHGLDLFGRGFEKEGFFVVRAAEKVLGFKAEDLHLPANKFDGIIAGTPCQDFSLANRTKRSKSGYGYKMLLEFTRLVTEAQPKFFVLENVPQVPDIEIEGYKIQRFNLNASECGLKQNRLRAFQFGTKEGFPLIVQRLPKIKDVENCCVATEFSKMDRRSFADFCELQGLPRNFELKHFTNGRKYELVGNGVPVPMAQLIAKSIRDHFAKPFGRGVTLCKCGCGREVFNKQTLATSACRQREKRKRDSNPKLRPGLVTISA